MRQLFYELIRRGTLEPTEPDYKALSRTLSAMRKRYEVRHELIVDGSDWQRAGRPSTGVELWVESESVAGTLVDLAAEFEVPVLVTRGIPSQSFLHRAAEQLRPGSVVLLVANHGAELPLHSFVARELREFGCSARVRRVAITEDQFMEGELFGKPTQAIIEIESMPPDQLKQLVRDALQRDCPVGHLAR